MRTATTLVLVGVIPLLLSGCVSSDPATDSSTSPTLAEMQRENERLREQLDASRKRNESARRGETVEILSTDVYFESASAELTPAGVNKLESVAQRIKQDYTGRTIRVEGHTDDTPIGDNLKDKWPSNWELSAARSAAVVRHLQWTHDVNPQRFEVVAYGPYQPVATNETKEGRSQNRRVRVAVLPARPSGTAAGPSSDSTSQSRW